MNTFLAFFTVIVLAGAAFGFSRTTEAMINPLEMAKLGLYQMPNGDWMAADPPSDSAQPAASAGKDAGHDATNNGQSPLKRKNRPSGQNQHQRPTSSEETNNMDGMGH